MAVVATSTPKRHGFSIESLIGRRDDSPRRPSHVHLPRPEDFSSTRDTCRDSPVRDLGTSGGGVVAGGGGGSTARVDSRGDGAAARDKAREHVRSVDLSRGDSVMAPSTPSPPQGKDLHRDALSVARDLYHSPRDSFRDAVRESFRDLHHHHHNSNNNNSQHQHRDATVLGRGGGGGDSILPGARDSSGSSSGSSGGGRGSQGEMTPRSADSFRGDGGLVMRPRSRQGTLSPPSSTTDDERPPAGGRRTSSPASSSPPPLQVSPRLEKTLSSSSPETENRLAGGWTSDDLKHLLGAGAFHHQGHHPAGVDGSSLYSPLRVCNRSLSAAMSSLMPHQFGGLPVNPLSFYNLHRELGPHPGAHPLLAARYPGFVHPRYPLGPPPGLLFHPYRKPKRNRTAFSPSQLLQLEQAFEKNHYVVGQERKTLAGKLQLTETQVKVWFQNRRTKHKRMKAEEEATGGVVTSGDDVSKTGADGHEGGPGDGRSDAEDHDMLEDDVCSSDEELSVTEDS